jgi:SAM-dependent methyltransferase
VGNLTDAAYWDEHHPPIEAAILSDAPHNNEYLYPILDRHFTAGEGRKTIFEVGFVPGQGLRKLADRYKLTPFGSDFCAEVEDAAKVLTALYPQSKFFHHDVGSSDVSESMGVYDIVYSGGLIEHFDDFETVIRRHLQLLEVGGLLLISTPNLSASRYALWKLLDPRLAAAHNPAATRLASVSAAIERCGGELLERGYFGVPHIWLEHPTHPLFAKLIVRGFSALGATVRAPERVWSPFVYWIAKKKSH